MKLTEFFGLDKLVKMARVLRANGGVGGAVKKRYLMDQNRAGTLVGSDKFGNRYYEDNSFYMPRNRWVEFPDRVWLDYDATQVPPEWHRWLHHSTDTTPTEQPPQNEKWVLDHLENTSIYEDRKYVPYSTTRAKIEGWTPNQSQQQPKK